MQVQPPPPNIGTPILLVLALWGALADWRYVKKGGKPAPKGNWRGLMGVLLLWVFVLIFLGIRGTPPYVLGSLTGMILILTFVIWEAWRLYVRYTNPLPKFPHSK